MNKTRVYLLTTKANNGTLTATECTAHRALALMLDPTQQVVSLQQATLWEDGDMGSYINANMPDLLAQLNVEKGDYLDGILTGTLLPAVPAFN